MFTKHMSLKGNKKTNKFYQINSKIPAPIAKKYRPLLE